MRVEDKVKDLVKQREALAVEYAAKQRDIDFTILNEIDVEYNVVSARIEQDRQALQDLATLRNTTRTKLGITEDEPKRKIIKMSARQIANVPVENGTFIPHNACDAIRHLLAEGEMSGTAVASEMTRRWQYSDNSFYSSAAKMVRSGEIVTRQGVGQSKIYRLAMK